MTFFDIAVLVVIGLAGLGGLSRGFVHEVLALAAWFAAIIAIYVFHAPLTDIITAFFRDNGTNAALIAFLILLIVPIFALRLTARWLGNKTRNSPLGFIDRILGLGFGLLKGLVLVVLTFSIVTLGYDTVWSAKGRPDWVRDARTYPFINAASSALVTTMSERREEIMDTLVGTDEPDATDATEATDAADEKE
ncbi:CvpA family protein [Croceicoccus sp. BE223]|uniref:CvpA family protein n=1 Tax=Croceicoccus sp. BE223 TaxID=2817716 RepID=UPI002862D41B|nr:CvpA family protein [Croceicoccus sp. BE223]MDR7103258.1 membrane protein required for colicin V production [Croceicoccus sp. BE223]